MEERAGTQWWRLSVITQVPTILVLLLLSALLAVVVSPPKAEAARKPVIYLTFDDGPGTHTNQFLDLLAAYNIHATFFVTGRQVANDPATAQRVVRDGHAIANHTWSHPNLNRTSSSNVLAQFGQTIHTVHAVTGVRTTCYRPPYGATSARVHQLAASVELTNSRWITAGSRRGLWDIDTGDWRLNVPRSGWSSYNMMQQLNRASDGDTILLHDGPGDRSRGRQVLADWLAVNRSRYDFQPLPGCGGIATELSIDPESPESWPRFQVGRLYKAYFDRQAEAAGLEYWTRTYSSGVPLKEISGYLATSPEFQSSGSLNDHEFVSFVYNAVLDREPDPEGLGYWVAQLTTGATDRGSLVVYFSESIEHIERTAPELTGGCYSGDVSSSYLCLSSTVTPYN